MNKLIKTVTNFDLTAELYESGAVIIKQSKKCGTTTFTSAMQVEDLGLLSGLVHEVQDAWAKHKYDEKQGETCGHCQLPLKGGVCPVCPPKKKWKK